MNSIRISLITLLLLFCFSCELPNEAEDVEEEVVEGGYGDITIYIVSGSLFASGYSLSDCGGYRITMVHRATGEVVGTEHITKTHNSSSVYCGIDGAATFNNLPVGTYNYASFCGDVMMNNGRVAFVEKDECNIQRY